MNQSKMHTKDDVTMMTEVQLAAALLMISEEISLRTARRSKARWEKLLEKKVL